MKVEVGAVWTVAGTVVAGEGVELGILGSRIERPIVVGTVFRTVVGKVVGKEVVLGTVVGVERSIRVASVTFVWVEVGVGLGIGSEVIGFTVAVIVLVTEVGRTI